MPLAALELEGAIMRKPKERTASTTDSGSEPMSLMFVVPRKVVRISAWCGNNASLEDVSLARVEEARDAEIEASSFRCQAVNRNRQPFGETATSDANSGSESDSLG